MILIWKEITSKTSFKNQAAKSVTYITQGFEPDIRGILIRDIPEFRPPQPRLRRPWITITPPPPKKKNENNTDVCKLPAHNQNPD